MSTLTASPPATIGRHYSTPENRGTTLDRDAIPPTLELPDETRLIVGIGGDAAPPNSRLFSYVLPAAELAKEHAILQPQLILSSSLSGKVIRLPEQEKHIVEVHTLEKIELIRRFIREFLPRTFAGVETYFGNHFSDVDPHQWRQLWDAGAEIDPAIDTQAQQLIERWHVDPADFYPYSTRHAVWFRDICAPTDTEIPYSSTAVHVTVGGRQEVFFNQVRSALSGVDADTVSTCLGETVELHPDRRQLIFPSNAQAVPYGQATKGSNGKTQSIEADVTQRNFHPANSRLNEDVQYSIRTVERLGAATEQDLNLFWRNCVDGHSQLTATISTAILESRGDYRRVLDLLPSSSNQ